MTRSTSTFLIHAHWVLSPGTPPRQDMVVEIQDGKIQTLSPRTNWNLNMPVDTQVDLLTPGLINAHTHLDLSGGKPIPKSIDEPMSLWLLKVTESREVPDGKDLSALTRERCIQGARRMLETGVTGVNDITQTADVLGALDTVGLKGVVSLEYFHPDFETLTLDNLISQFQTDFFPWSSHSRMWLGLSPHAPYNVSPRAWKATVNKLQPILVHTHVAECQDERDWLLGRKPNGIDGIHRRFLNRMFTPQPGHEPLEHPDHSPEWQYLKAHHVLDITVPTVLAHGSLLTPADLAQLQTMPNTMLVHCPLSNEFLHHTTLSNIPEEAQSHLCLGTDSQLSHPTLDIRDDARRACELHGWSAKTVFNLLTENGARALGWAQQTGTLQPGFAADLTAWTLPPNSLPNPSTDNLYEQWLSPACTVEKVWVDGQCRYTAPHRVKASQATGAMPTV